MPESKFTGRFLEVRSVPLDELVANPLNANRMSEELLAKLRVNIATTGLYPHIIARPHPALPGKLELLDGHHRVTVLRELGHAEARVDLWAVNDRDSKILLATLNRLQGQDVPIRRAELLHELLAEMSADDLAGLLPEDEKQLADLHSLLEFPADEIAAQLAEQAAEEDKLLPQVLTYVVSPEQAEVIEQAVERASDGTAGRDRKARGLTNLAKQYLEGSDVAPLKQG
ncbi:MAG: ParB/RepB/Spo0J family partition protein [Candidatus Eisenbacteria bacterium]